MRILIGVLCCLLHAAFAAPPLINFDDGKIGVNFLGYHAEAGLGGLLTGNRAHGGLSASAGTPHGQEAVAGLNGQVNDRTAGIAYAGAQASPSVGASAKLAGGVGEYGFLGSEAHANNKKYLNTQQIGPQAQLSGDPTTASPAQMNHVQKIKPPKKYTLIKNELNHNDAHFHQEEAKNSQVAAESAATGNNRHNVPVATSENGAGGHVAFKNGDAGLILIGERERRQRKRVKHPRQRVRVTYVSQKQLQPQENSKQQPTSGHTAAANTEANYNVVHTKKIIKSVEQPATQSQQSSDPFPPPTTHSHARPGVVVSALNIPIGILRSLQESLSGLGGSAQFQKQINY